jgi:hypothetical protein
VLFSTPQDGAQALTANTRRYKRPNQLARKWLIVVAAQASAISRSSGSLDWSGFIVVVPRVYLQFDAWRL